MRNAKGLATACVLGVALLAVAGWLARPRPVHGQEPQPGQHRVAAGGVTGCYNCDNNPSPGNTGCDGYTSPPSGMVVGYCVSGARWETCLLQPLVCGRMKNCLDGSLTPYTCSTLSVCQ